MAEATESLQGTQKSKYIDAVEKQIAEYESELLELQAKATKLDEKSRATAEQRITEISTQRDSNANQGRRPAGIEWPGFG